MIIVRSPMRVPLGGGGTDLASYYRKHGGFALAAAIDKYVYITLHTNFTETIIVKYSRLEHVTRVDDLQHPIIREALRMTGVLDTIEIASMADIPAGTGLGSSGSFTTALLKALHTYRRRPILVEELAAQACEIEIGRLGEPVGKQDQYAAAFGGVTCFDFRPDESVAVAPLAVDSETLLTLEENLLLFFTGASRSASAMLREQDDRLRQGDPAMVDNLHAVKALGLRSRALLEAGDLSGFGAVMNEHWRWKKQRTRSMSNPDIDRAYDLALGSGAVGGKLIGAGGGGFLLFYVEDKRRVRHAMREAGLKEVRFRFDFEGAKVIVS